MPHEPHHHHGNPEDLTAYLAKLDSPDRDEWQKPDEVLRAIGIRAGQTACEIGAGSGYFTLRMAAQVGAGGQVFAVEVEPRLLIVLRDRLVAAGARNVTPVLGLDADPLLPRASCDLILIVNTFHHFSDGTAYLKRLVEALKPGGRLVNIDFHNRETPVGPPVEHRINRAVFLTYARAAGLKLAGEHELLPHQYFLVLEPR
ncbi:MAG: class I SAM-dependent methyltransferase [Polyangia bacterium]